MLDLYAQIIKYRTLDSWFKSMQGRQVARVFAHELNKHKKRLKGDRLLQIGVCGDNLWLNNLRYKEKWLVTPYLAELGTFVSSLLQLPLDNHSVDCVVAPLMLEAFPYLQNPLDEIDRILKPMGYIIFYGINPWSLWGASMRFGKHACFARHHGTLTMALSLKHAMLDRGYQQRMLSRFYYIPPLLSESLIRNLEFLNVMGKMIWPTPPGFYCMIFQKQQPCLSQWLQDVAKEPFLLRRTPSLASSVANARFEKGDVFLSALGGNPPFYLSIEIVDRFTDLGFV